MKTGIISIFLTGMIALLSSSIMAQDNEEPVNIKFKVYINGFYERVENDRYNGELADNQTYKYESKDWDIGFGSIAVEMKKNNKTSQEIEWIPFRFGRVDYLETITDEENIIQIISGSIITSFHSAIRYQYNYYILADKTITPYLGLSSQMYYDLFMKKPKVSLSYPERDQNLGLFLAVTPGVEIKIGKQLGLNLDIPVGFIDIFLNSERIDSPTLPLNLRSTSTITGNLFPHKLCFRLGLSYKLMR